jgi:hypothetical protein
LSNAKFQAIDNFRMWILRSTQNKLVTLKDVDKAGVALDQRRSKFDHAIQNVVKAVSRAETNTDFVE